MKQITNKTLLKQGDRTYQPVEVEGGIYWYEDKVIPYAGEIKAICLAEIQANIDYGVKLGDNQYITPFVNKVGKCYGCRKIVAQSQAIIEGIPVISLDSYTKPWYEKANELYPAGKLERKHTEQQSFKEGVKWKELNLNQYTQKDVEKAIELARDLYFKPFNTAKQEILEQINSISLIEVDEQFNILSYE